jgi:hypothetical protein
MSRTSSAVTAEPRSRHRLPVPFEMRAQQPFLVDAYAGHIIAPWPRRRPAAGDDLRLWETMQRLDLDALPAPLCWAWPDRAPVPVAQVGAGWLAAYSRDHAVYRLPERIG